MKWEEGTKNIAFAKSLKCVPHIPIARKMERYVYG